MFINVGTSRSAQSWILRSPRWRADNDTGWEYLGPGGTDTDGLFDRAADAMAIDFLEAIARDRDPVCTIDDGRWTIEMIAGIYRSHFSGSRVAFPLRERGDRFQA